MTLNENAVKGTGNILIKKTTDDSLVETINVTSGLVTISNMEVTINPSVTLDLNTQYYVQVPATAFDDTAGNSYAGITDTTSWSFTTVADSTAPTISNISIPNSAMKVGDTITVTITVTSDADNYTTGSGAITGTIGGFALGTLAKTNNTTYTAQFTVTDNGTDVASGSDIPVSFTLKDSSGNTSTAHTTPITQDSDSIDANKPTLSNVTIASNNTDTSKAKIGEIVTISFTASETLSALPTATIATNAATVTNTSGLNYTATFTMTDSQSAGVIAFAIDFSDVATNAGTQVTAVTSGTGVTFDKTAPSGYGVTITTDPINNANKSALAFTFSGAEVGTTYNYSIDDTNASTTAITGSGTIATATDTISAIDVSSLDDDTLTLSVTLTDPTGNIGTSATDTVLKDVVLPTLTEVTPIATTTSDSTPDYTFSTTETGTIVLGGSCGTSTSKTISSTGNHTITLTHTDESTALSDATYSNCTITLSDANGNASPALSIPSFTVDTTTPTATFTPLTGADHPKNSNLTITFNEAVRKTDDTEITDANVASLITLKETDGSGLDVAFNATIDATKKIITINPTSDLTESQTYYLAYADVEDVVDHTRAGENITFTAEADTTAPLANTFSPSDDSTTALVDSNLSVVFDENIQIGTGNIVIKYDANDTAVETFDVTSSDKIFISGTTLTINPTNNLDFNTKYYVEIEATAIKDTASTPNTYLGVTNKGDWDFTTYDKLSLSALEGANISYTESDGNVSISSLIEVTNPSDENLTNATISISSGFVSSEDKLHFTDANGITGDFNTTTGVLSLSGDANSSTYQVALRTITYENINQSDINTTSRIVDINVTDRLATSTTLQRTIDITAVDNTPDTFSFTALTNKSKSTSIESNTVTISGIENNITISVSGGEYKIGEGNYTTVAGTIDNDENVTLRQTSSSSYSTKTTTSLTIGDTTKAFDVTTLAAPSSGGGGGYIAPTQAPTQAPTEAPTDAPTQAPTQAPTDAPTQAPTQAPTEAPTQVPTEAPTDAPTQAPTPEKETIILIDDNAGEEAVVINDIVTKTNIETYEDFSDNEDGSSSAKVDFKDEDGKTTSTEIKTNIEKENITITSTDTGIETKAEVKKEDGTSTQTSSTVNANGTLTNKVVSTDTQGVQTTSNISSTKVGTNVEIATDGSLTNSYKDTKGLEIKAVASSNGDVEHEVDITDEDGNVVKTIAKSDIKGSSVVIKKDGSVQTISKTISKTTDANGVEENFEILSVVESDSTGKATHIMQVKDSTGNSVITKAKSEILGATTTITQSGIQTKATAKTTKTDANGNISTRDIEFEVQASPDGSATHRISFKDDNGVEVVTQARSKVKGATTTIKADNTINTEAQITDESGKIYKAIVNTDADGQSSSWFEITDPITGETTKELTVEAGIFEEGNTATISEDGGVLKMNVETKVTKTIQF